MWWIVKVNVKAEIFLIHVWEDWSIPQSQRLNQHFLKEDVWILHVYYKGLSINWYKYSEVLTDWWTDEHQQSINYSCFSHIDQKLKWIYTGNWGCLDCFLISCSWAVYSIQEQEIVSFISYTYQWHLRMQQQNNEKLRLNI